MTPENTTENTLQTLQENLAKHAGKYVKSCHNLLCVIIFTLINIFLLLTNSNSYFLFSAAIPRTLIDLGMFMCGKYPLEYYGNVLSYSFYGNGFFIAMIAGAVIVLGLYLLCWFMAAKKKKGAWLIVGLVLFIVDTIMFFYWYGFATDMIIDLVFRVWIGFSLIQGITSFFSFKKLSAELAAIPQETEVVTEEIDEAAVAEEETTEENTL